jgi:hypothetical protein
MNDTQLNISITLRKLGSQNKVTELKRMCHLINASYTLTIDSNLFSKTYNFKIIGTESQINKLSNFLNNENQKAKHVNDQLDSYLSN